MIFIPVFQPGNYKKTDDRNLIVYLTPYHHHSLLARLHAGSPTSLFTAFELLGGKGGILLSAFTFFIFLPLSKIMKLPQLEGMKRYFLVSPQETIVMLSLYWICAC